MTIKGRGSGVSDPKRPLASISRAGADVEALFLLLTGARPPERAALGDAILDGNYIEVKKASGPTLNQVRAVKYLPLVVLHTPAGRWFVVPPNEVVRLCATKRRGQHTENPFESATLSLGRLQRYAVADDSSLREAVRAAIIEGSRYPILKGLMAKVLADSQALAANSVAAASQALAAEAAEL